jgi:hypothetical protein
MQNRVYAGDVVTFVSNHVYDPLGTGSTVATSQTALVLGARWDYTKERGSATLLLMNRYRGHGKAWAPACLITAKSSSEITVASYEFGDSTKDPEDGNAFGANDVCFILDRNPSDPTANTPQTVTIQDAYETAGANTFTLDVAMTADPTAGEFVLIFADYGSQTASQKLRASSQANVNSELLAGSIKAYRYG